MYVDDFVLEYQEERVNEYYKKIKKEYIRKEKKKFKEEGLKNNKIIAIKWFKKRIEELGGEFEDAVKFEENMLEYVNNSIKALDTAALICTSSTFINKKKGKRSLKDILDKAGVLKVVENIVISITIVPNAVIVVDSTVSRNREKLKYDSVEDKFSFVSVHVKNYEMF